MATQNITEPIILDSTGQQILTAIQDLAEAVQPTNVYVDIAATLSASNWSSATPSVYTWTNSKVTGECAVEVFFATGASNAPTPYIEYEKGVGSVIFYAPTGKPTVDLPVVIRIINAEAEIASDIDADMVATDAISGASNVQEALTSVNSSIGQLNSKITGLIKIKEFSLTTDNGGAAVIVNGSTHPGRTVIGVTGTTYPMIVTRYGKNYLVNAFTYSGTIARAANTTVGGFFYYIGDEIT